MSFYSYYHITLCFRPWFCARPRNSQLHHQHFLNCVRLPSVQGGFQGAQQWDWRHDGEAGHHCGAARPCWALRASQVLWTHQGKTQVTFSIGNEIFDVKKKGFFHQSKEKKKEGPSGKKFSFKVRVWALDICCFACYKSWVDTVLSGICRPG